MTKELLESALQELIENSHELTPSFVPYSIGTPTSLAFLRQVHKNFPMVYKGAVDHWPSLDSESEQFWSKTYLVERLSGTAVQVAETPFGNADAPVDGQYFVLPHTSKMEFGEFIHRLTADDDEDKAVYYMQSQNNNIPTEFPMLKGEIELDLPWASEALDLSPEAVNLWIGSGRSTTSLHKDPYENLHVQVLGKKVFKLIAPSEYVCVRERDLLERQYVKHDSQFELKEISDKNIIPWPTMDPQHIDSKDKWQRQSRVLEVVLEPGDMLYLPALWFHQVGQESDNDGICCSVNFWYDMDYSGPQWTTNNFLRACAYAVEGRKPTRPTETDLEITE
ncbi:phospholipase A2 [Lipomyces oligophaga]|uniref:phospholipase A2 n=1 Tax=Lipomyces oligophaga TaxID=45792 RepID=UPI0034CE178C